MDADKFGSLNNTLQNKTIKDKFMAKYLMATPSNENRAKKSRGHCLMGCKSDWWLVCALVNVVVLVKVIVWNK